MHTSSGGHQSLVGKARRNELLSYLFEWLIENLKTLNPIGLKESAETKGSKMEKHLTRTTVLALLRRSLLASLPGNKQLVASAIALAQLTGERSLIQKLKKLALLEQPLLPEANTDETLLSQQEHSICEAREKLESVKRKRMMQRKHEQPYVSDVGTKRRWSVAKSWTPCPIGMLPQTIGFSGKLPTLDCVDSCREVVAPSGVREVTREQSNGKREAEVSTVEMDATPVKKVATEADFRRLDECDSIAEGIEGFLMIDGVWKKVEEEELFAIASAVKLMI